ncbi:MAG: hypothetical protein AAFX01_01020 [Cyanobacteria bacterium J06638_28]
MGMAVAAPSTLSIEQGYQQPNGTEIVVSGIVTVPSGRFASAIADQGFALQDQSGGIYVSTEKNLALPIGAAVTVQGTLQDDGHGQQVLRLLAWTQQEKSFQAVVPQAASVDEAIHAHGQLVTVQGTIAQPLQLDAPYGDRLWMQDDTGTVQIYIPRSTQIFPEELPFLTMGQAIQITGLSSQYDGHDEVVPRRIEDIQPAR